MYNKRVLTKAVNELDKPKAPVRKNSNAKIVTNSTPIISSEGYKQGPPPEGTHYRIPGNKLYNPTPYPITAVSDNGITKTLQPYDETNVDFPGALYVDEFTAKKGGSLPNIPKKKNSKGYSRSLEATNKLFAQNPLTKKPKSRKRKIFDPNSKYYQIGGVNSPVQLTSYYSFDQSESPEAWATEIKNLERQIGNPVQWTNEDYELMQNKLNDYQTWRKQHPEVRDLSNKPNEYVVPLPYHLRKKQIGGEAAYVDLNLTDEEIEVYRAGGYIVEELPKAQLGKYLEKAANLYKDIYKLNPFAVKSIANVDDYYKWGLPEAGAITPNWLKGYPYLASKLPASEWNDLAKYKLQKGKIYPEGTLTPIEKEKLYTILSNTRDKDLLAQLSDYPVETGAFKSKYLPKEEVGNIQWSNMLLPVDYASEHRRNLINSQLYGNYNKSNFNRYGLMPFLALGTTVLAGAFLDDPKKNAINRKLGYPFYPTRKQYDESLTTRDTIINLNDNELTYGQMQDRPEGRILLGGDFVGDEENTVRPAKSWLENRYGSFGDDDQKVKDVKSYYGVEDGKLILGSPKSFKPDTKIVPNRYDDGRYVSKAKVHDGKLRLVDANDRPIYQNAQVEGKLILHSGNSKNSIFVSHSGKDTKKTANQINNFIKNNNKVKPIVIDNGRFREWMHNESGITNQNYDNFYSSDFDRGPNAGYNIIIKKDGGLVKAQTGKNVRYTSDPNDPGIKAYTDSMALYNKFKAAKSNYINTITSKGFDPSYIEEWSTDGYVDKSIHPKIGAIKYGILQNSGGGYDKYSSGKPRFFTDYPTKSGSQLKVYEDTELGKIIGTRYPIYKKPVQPVVYKEYKPNLDTDLAAWLKTQKAPASYANRKKLYEQATGKADYKGTAEQNIGLLKLLKQEGLDYKLNSEEVPKSVQLPQDSQLIELPTKSLTPIKPDTIKVPSMQLKWFQTPTGTWYQDYVPDELDYNINTGGYIELELTPEEIEEYKKGGYVVEDISIPELTKAQTGIQKGVVCDTDRCEETDKIQEILDNRDRAITDSLKTDNAIAEKVWNEDVSAEKLFNKIGIKSANQQLNTLAPNCSNYATGSLRCIDPSIDTEHTLSNYRFNKAVKENKTPFELVGTYKGVGNIPPEILQRGDLVSELYDGHGHMIKYTGTNNDEPAYLHSSGSKDSWGRVDSPEDWMTHTTHVYRYHPDEMDKIPMLEEIARTNPTYYGPGKLPLRPVQNISQNNLNTLDLGNATFKYGGLPKAQSGLSKLTSLLKPFSRTTTNLETLQLPKLPQLELELPEITLPKYGMTDLEKVINKAAPHYVNRATDPRNFERAAALDAEYGTNYVQGLKELEKHLDERNIGELPLNIKIEKNPDDGSGGYSGWTDEGKMKNVLGHPTSIRDRKIVLYDNTDPSDVRRILPHEGKHHYTMAIPNFYSNAWGDFMSSTLEPLTEINKTNPAFADKLIKPAFKGADYSIYEYFEKPQEIDAYINTNLRDQLVDEGILEHHWDTLDDSKVAEFLMSNPQKHSKAYLNLLKSKDFIKMFNKGVYAIPAAISAGAMSEDYKAGGEYKLGDTVDKAKMRELEKLGYTLEIVK